MKLRSLLIAAIGLAVSAGAAGAASAATPWQNHHPRRVEVNQRLDHLNYSIHRQHALGNLTGLQARRLEERDHMIRVQERTFARHDGSHITRHEQRRLNHEENGVRHRIP